MPVEHGSGAGTPRRPRRGGTGVAGERHERALLIAAPMRIEAALISSAARGALVRKTGMGPRALAGRRGRAGRDSAGALLVLGFCGGLDATSVPGEVIVAEEVYAAGDEGHAEQRVRCDLRDRARAALDRAGD